jgi:tetratricopeptide (TPR) repeat protein
MKWSDPAVQTVLIVMALTCGGVLFVGESGFAVYKYYQGRKHSNAVAFLAEAERANRQHRDAEVARNLEACISLAPDILDAYAQLAQVLARMGSLETADSCLVRMLAANPDNPHALVVQGRWYALTKRIDLAEKSAEDALTLAPTDSDGLFLAAQCAAMRKQYHRVVEVSTKLAEYHPWFPAVYSLAAEAEMRLGNSLEAIDWLRKGVRVSPQDEGMLWTLGHLLIDHNYFHALEPVIAALRDIPRAKSRGNFLQARCDYAQGHWLVACEAFKTLRPEFASQPALLEQLDSWLADCYRQIGDPELQLAAVQAAAKDNPAAPSLRDAEVAALLAAGRTNEAMAVFRELMKQPGMAHDAPLQLARLLLVKNLSLEPAKRSWKEVELALAGADELEPRPMLVDIIRAEMFFARDQPDKAERVLLEAQQKNPEQLGIRLVLAAVAARQRNWAKSFKLLDEAKTQLGDGVALRLARATTYAMQMGGGANQRLRRLSERTGRLPERDLVPLWRGLATIALRVGNTALAEKLYRQVLTKVPNNSEGWRFLLELALRKRDPKAVEVLLGQIQDTEGRGPHWHFGRAVLFRLRAEENNAAPLWEKAQRHLATARSLRPSWPNIPLLTAEVDDRQGNELSAVANYVLALRLGERNPATIRRVMLYLWQQHRFVEIDQVLRLVRRQQSAVLTDLVQQGHDISLRLDDFSQAEAPAVELAAKSSDPRDRIWLAQVLEILGSAAAVEHRPDDAWQLFDRAAEVLRHSVATNDTQPLCWAALIQFYCRQECKADALAAIAQARLKLPPDAAPLLPAESYEALGDLLAAEKEYRSLIASTTNTRLLDRCAEFFTRAGKAEQLQALLLSMISGKQPAQPAAVSWARRRHAWDLANSGLPGAREAAFKLLQQNIQSEAPSPEDRRMQVLVLASSGSPESRPEAIRVLEEMRREQRTLGPEEQFLLSRLYLLDGDWANASRQMRNLLVYHGDEPRYLVTYITALLGRREVSEAETWLEWLETLVPEQYTTVALRAEDLFYRGRFEQAAKLLQEFLEKHDSQPTDRVSRLKLISASLQEFARGLHGTKYNDSASLFGGPAETMRRELLTDFPEQGMPLAALLAEEGRLDEALELAEKSVKAASAEALSDTAMALLEASTLPAQTERIEKLLRGALEQQKRPAVLLTALARVLTMEKRYREAISLLREALEKEPGSVEALRNLSMQLALQRIKLTEALELVQNGIRIAGPTPALLDTRALVYLALSQPDKARRDIEAALGQSQSPTYFYHYFRACAAEGEKKLAGEALAKARSYGLRPEMLHPLERAALSSVP